jgi:hypothetical protein
LREAQNDWEGSCGSLWRDSGLLFNLARPDFPPKAVDAGTNVAHKFRPMTTTTKRTVKTTKPFGGSGGVRA